MIIKALRQKHIQPYFANTSWLFLENMTRSVIGLFVLGYMARYLGPQQYGQLSFAIAFVLIPSVLAGLGLRDIVVRDLVKGEDKVDEILATALILKFLGGIIVCFICLGAIMLIRPADIITWWLVGILATSSIFMAFEVTDFWFQSQVKSKYTVISKLIVFLTVSLLRILFIYFKAPLIAFALTFLLEIMLQSGAFLIAYRISGKSIKIFQATWNRAKDLLSTCCPVVFGAFALYIQSYIDQIMLGQMLGDAEVGQYSAALRIVEFFIIFPTIICSSIAPAITRAKMKDKDIYQHYLLNTYRFMFILFILMVIPILLCARIIISSLYGPAYQYSAGLLSLLSFRLFFANFGIVRNQLFIVNDGLFKYSLFTASIGAITNILLNLMLIPKYHSFGAIGASMISFSITIFVIDAFYSRTRGNIKIMVQAITSFPKFKI